MGHIFQNPACKVSMLDMLCWTKIHAFIVWRINNNKFIASTKKVKHVFFKYFIFYKMIYNIQRYWTLCTENRVSIKKCVRIVKKKWLCYIVDKKVATKRYSIFGNIKSYILRNLKIFKIVTIPTPKFYDRPYVDSN